MRHLDAPARIRRSVRSSRSKHAVGVVDLSGLVILAAEDHEVVVAMRLDPQVVIRIGGIPEQRVRNRPFSTRPATT